MPKKQYISETLFKHLGLETRYEVGHILCEEQTKYQHLLLFEHPFFGKMLILDDVVQLTMRDEFIYHEMMTHVPLLTHGGAKDVLIVGGGDCGIAKEVIKHQPVESLTQVEIDASVITFSKKYFPEFTKPVFSDRRFESIIGDGMNYVTTTKRKFDVIIVDSTDPQGPGKVLFTREFYAACKRILRHRGIMVTQNGVPFFQPDELKESLRHFRSLFRHGGCYLAAIPTYIGGHMAMGWASRRDLSKQSKRSIAKSYEEAGAFATKYWTPDIHLAAFALPRFISEAIK